MKREIVFVLRIQDTPKEREIVFVLRIDRPKVEIHSIIYAMEIFQASKEACNLWSFDWLCSSRASKEIFHA